jgi:hypothetical protein
LYFEFGNSVNEIGAPSVRHPHINPFLPRKEIGYAKMLSSWQLKLMDCAIIMRIRNILAGDELHLCGAYADKREKEAE